MRADAGITRADLPSAPSTLAAELGVDTSVDDQDQHPVPPRVSVILPSKDRPDFLRRSVRTALDQVDVEVEVIVVDDGSEEPAVDGLDADPRLRVLRVAPSRGVANARNVGVAAASHEWIAFLDDDDIWSPAKLATQIAAMSAQGRRWSHSGTVRLTAELELTEVTSPDQDFATYPSILQVNGVATPSAVVIERTLLEESGGFDPAFSTMADWDLWIRVARIAPALAIDAPLVGYVIHEGSMHRQNTRSLFRELRAIKRKYRGGPPVAGPYVWKWIAETHRRTGHWLTCWPLYALPVLLCPAATWRSRGRIVRGAADNLGRALRLTPPLAAAAPPAWLAGAAEPSLLPDVA